MSLLPITDPEAHWFKNRKLFFDLADVCPSPLHHPSIPPAPTKTDRQTDIYKQTDQRRLYMYACRLIIIMRVSAVCGFLAPSAGQHAILSLVFVPHNKWGCTCPVLFSHCDYFFLPDLAEVRSFDSLLRMGSGIMENLTCVQQKKSFGNFPTNIEH